MIVIEKTLKGRFFTLLAKLLKVKIDEINSNTYTSMSNNWVKIEYNAFTV